MTKKHKVKRKLTTCKIDEELFQEFRIECIRRKFTFQKLAERAVDLYLRDEEFRRKITNHRPGTLNTQDGSGELQGDDLSTPTQGGEEKDTTNQ